MAKKTFSFVLELHNPMEPSRVTVKNNIQAEDQASALAWIQERIAPSTKILYIHEGIYTLAEWDEAHKKDADTSPEG